MKPLNNQSTWSQEPQQQVKYSLHHLKHLHSAQHQRQIHVSQHILLSPPTDTGEVETQKKVKYPNIQVTLGVSVLIAKL